MVSPEKVSPVLSNQHTEVQLRKFLERLSGPTGGMKMSNSRRKEFWAGRQAFLGLPERGTLIPED